MGGSRGHIHAALRAYRRTFGLFDCLVRKLRQPHFVGGLAPALINPKLAEKTRQLCFSEFTVLHSGITRGPLWSAEDLSRETLALAAAHPRPASNTFHEDARLPGDERSSLDDYRRSGYDRGHMTPNGDMTSPQAQQESFTLANIVPQDACNNERIGIGAGPF